jgi:DNA polymerase-1
MVAAPGKGNPNSGIFLIMDRPNFTEDERMVSFSGSASRLFMDILAKAGVDYPNDVYLTYAFKCHHSDLAPKELKKESAAKCPDTWLYSEIKKYKPKVIVALGADVMRLLLPNATGGVMKNRGAFFDSEEFGYPVKIMPSLSPAYLSLNREMEHQAVLDVKRAFSAVNGGVQSWTPEKLSDLYYRTVHTYDDFLVMNKEILEAKVVAADIETRGKDAYSIPFTRPGFPLVSIQFSTGPKSGWFLPIAHAKFIDTDNPQGMAWGGIEWSLIKTSLRHIFESGDLFVIGHNFKFDSKWINKFLSIKTKLSFDTMLAHGLFGETTNSLKKIAWELTDLGGYEEAQSQYTDSLEYDQQWDMFYYPYEQLATYGCCDVDVTYRAFTILDKKLEAEPQLLSLFKTLVKASRAFLDIEHEGIKINREQLALLDIDLNLEIRRLSGEFKQMLGPQIAKLEEELRVEATSTKTGRLLSNKTLEFNIDSSSHICKLFYEYLGIEVNDRHRSKKTKEPSVGRKALEEMEAKHPAAKLLIAHRVASKQKAAFVDAYPRFIDENDRIHPDYKLIKFFNEDEDKEQGTATGRLACSNPNLQQVPSRDDDKKIKRLFIPDYPNHYLLDADYSGIELRVTAMYCQDPIMINFFNSGAGDFHRHVASKVYGKPEDQISKLERTYAKSTTFGILYGAGPSKIAEQAKCSVKDATAFIEEYFKLFPTLKKWIMQQKAYAQKHLYVKSLFGRIRRLPDAASRNEAMREAALRRAINTPIQSDASDITLYGLTRIHSFLNSFPHADHTKPSRLRGSVHDSILVTVHEDDLEQIASTIKFDILESPNIDFILKSGVKLQSEISVGKNWGSVIELKTEG